MFEQELELEKKSSSILPLLLMVTLIVGIAGVALYFVLWSRTELSAAEASPIVLAALERLGPATVHFATGEVEDQTAPDPRYRLLEKAGYLKIGKEQKGKTPISLTAEGQAWLTGIAGVKEKKTDEGIEYIVPLAQRKLVQMGKITMLSPMKASVDYTWKWEPTKAGELLDAAGPAVKAFGTYDRSTLIDKFGAAFYHADPTKITILLAKRDNGWEITRE
ncbi:MAG: hypothetical protein WCC04_05320 [Terriglobales bacterium]